MVVDDENLIVYALSETLRDGGTVLVTASDGKAALKAISEVRFDLCFLDVYLPDMSGLELMRKIRQVSPETRIIIMTGSVVTDSMMEAIRENAHGLMSKPFELDQVKEFADWITATDMPWRRDELKAFRDRMLFLEWITDDDRRHERKPACDRIACLTFPPHDDKAAVPLTAEVLDVSETGMCIRTDCRLKPGHILRLSDLPPETTAVVRWSEPAGDSASYHAGIQFLNHSS